MPGVEAFSILAVFEAVDKASRTIDKVDRAFEHLSETARLAAESAGAAGAEIDASLLETASGADAVEVATARATAAQSRMALATEELAGAERQLIAAQSQAAAAARGDAVAMAELNTALERLTAAERTAALASRDLAAAEARSATVADAAAAANVRASRAHTMLAAGADKAKAAMVTATKVATGVGLAVAAVGYVSLKAATSFQTLTTRLATTAGEPLKNLAMIRQGIMDIAMATGATADELAKGMYIVASAGYHGAEGLTVLKAATEGAKMEGADFATVSNAVTDALKDYHLKAGAAATVTSQLITSVSYGKTTFQAMSAAMANVLPLASSLNISIQDVSGVLAEMTAHGMTAQRASQNIANAMRELAVPTHVMEKEFGLFNITSKQVQDSLGTRGLAGTMQWLASVAKEGAPKVGQTYNEALKRLTGTAQGLQVALLTTGENTNDTNAAIKAIGGATADAQGNVKDFTETQKTLAAQMDKVKATMGVIGITIGTALLPAVTKLLSVVAKLLVPVAHWIQHHQKLTAIIIGGLAGIAALTLLVAGLSAAIDLLISPVGAVVAIIALLVAGFIYAYNHSKTFHDIAVKLGKFLKTAFVAAWKTAGDIIDWFNTSVLPVVKDAIKSVIDWFSSHKQVFIDAWNTVVHAIQGAVQWFNDNVLKWLKDRIKDVTDWFSQHSSEIKHVWNILWTVLQTAVKVWWDGFMHPMLKIIQSVWTIVWGVIRDTVKTVWAIISGIVTFWMHVLMNTIGVILDLISGHWGKAWKDLKKLGTDALHDAINAITNIASNFGSLLWDAGANIVKGLINGIKSMVGAAGSAISDVVGAIKDHLPWSPAKKGPLSGRGAPEIGGRNIVKLLARGMTDGTSDVISAMEYVTGAANMTLKTRLTANVARGGGAIYGAVAGAPAGGAGTTLYFDLRGSQVMSDHDMDALVNKIGQRVATRVLPAGGTRIRM